MNEKVDMNDVSYIIASEIRTVVITELHKGFRSPSEIAENQDRDIAHVSRSISDLQDRGLVELIVDEETKKGRLYDLAEAGRPVADAVVERN